MIINDIQASFGGDLTVSLNRPMSDLGGPPAIEVSSDAGASWHQVTAVSPIDDYDFYATAPIPTSFGDLWRMTSDNYNITFQNGEFFAVPQSGPLG